MNSTAYYVKLHCILQYQEQKKWKKADKNKKNLRKRNKCIWIFVEVNFVIELQK